MDATVNDSGGDDATVSDTGTPDAGSDTSVVDTGVDAGPAFPTPIAGYHFDEGTGTTATDFTGHGNTGTILGGVTWTTGKVNGALHLDGVDGYVQLPSNLLSGAKAFTIATWVNADTDKNWTQLIDFGIDKGTYLVVIPQNGNNGLLRMEMKYGGDTNGGNAVFDKAFDGLAPLATTSWQHVAIVGNGTDGTVAMYLNGVLQMAQAGYTFDPNFGAYVNDWIGKSEWGDPPLVGAVDEFVVYDQALTADQVQTLANAGSAPDGGSATPAPIAGYHFDEGTGTTATDFTGHNNTGTILGGVTWSTGEKNGALHLDGVDGYVQLPSNLLSGAKAFTIATWVNADTDKNWTQLIDFGIDKGTYLVVIPQNGNNGLLRMEMKYGGDTNGGNAVFDKAFDGLAPLPTGSWQHVAIVGNATDGTVVLYLNGVVQIGQAGFTFDPNFGAYVNNWIGKSEWGDPPLVGAVDEFVVYDQALTAAQVKALATP